MDEDGYASFACAENLARRAGVELSDCIAALECFMSPDKRAPEQEYEGRRLERVSGGYIVLNAGKYRNMFSREIQKEQTRKRVAKFREKSKRNANVTPCNESVTQSEAEAEAEAEAVPHTPSAVPHTPSYTSSAPEQKERVRDLRSRLCVAYNRKTDDRWDYNEETLLVEIARERPNCLSELTEMLVIRPTLGRFFPKSISSLLLGWTKTLDVARTPHATKNEDSRRIPEKRVDRSIGTANEGTADMYRNAPQISGAKGV